MDLLSSHIFILNTFMMVIFAGVCTPYANAQRMAFGRKLDVHIIETIIAVSADSCMNECNKRISCGSINYHRLKKLCELNSKTTLKRLNLSIAPGYLFKQKATYHVDRCNNICGPGKVCNDVNKCETEECRDLHVINGIAKGNLKRVGSKSVVNCSHGYGIDKSLSRARCERHGMWSYGDKRVCRKICKQPKNIDDGEWVEADVITPSGGHVYTGYDIDNVVNETIFSGSYIKYKCNDNLHIYGPAIAKCENREWSELPVCFYRPCRLQKDDSCPERSLACSDTVCNCVNGIGNFSLKICVQNCTAESGWFPESNSTAEQPEAEAVNVTYVSPGKCDKICRRARDFSCESLYPRMFDFMSDNSHTSTCMLWSNSFKDRSAEQTWWTEAACPFKPDELV